MTQKITKWQRWKMFNPIIQLFRYIYLSLKILVIVAGGHGGTKEPNKL